MEEHRSARTIAAIGESRWEHFPHGADIGVRGMGPTLESAFEQAAVALTAAITDPAAIANHDEIEVACAAEDDEALLVEWLNTLIYEMAVRSMLFGCFRLRIEGHKLQARARGEPVDVARHSPAVEAKGATFTELSVDERPDGTWVAQCVVDV